MYSKEILALEKENNANIILLKEGIFWRAYNVSAYLFLKYITAYKIKKKHIKLIEKVFALPTSPNS